MMRAMAIRGQMRVRRCPASEYLRFLLLLLLGIVLHTSIYAYMRGWGRLLSSAITERTCALSLALSLVAAIP